MDKETLFSDLLATVNAVPGGIVCYRVEEGQFIPVFFSEGILGLSGHTHKEYEEMIKEGVFNIIYEADRERVIEAAKTALLSGGILDVSYRMYHKNGGLIWVHLNGKRMGPLTESTKFYAVFTGMSEESRLYQSIANETENGIYVIERKNFNLLYANESEALFLKTEDYIGRKCYEALHGRKEPCEFCNLRKYKADGKWHEMEIKEAKKVFNVRLNEGDWNGIPTYTVVLQDITQMVKTRREKEKLEQYFQTVVKNLPGGVAVVRCEKDGALIPEFMSDGFAEMTGMTPQEVWELYRYNAMAGVHPDDIKHVNEQMEYIRKEGKHCEITYRLIKGDGSYVWVKNTLSLIANEGSESRVYAIFQDLTKEREEQEQTLQHYREQLIQHYRISDPDVLIVGHCSITKNRILEIIDHTDSRLLETFGYVREDFFTGMSALIEDEKERQGFLDRFLNAPALAAYEQNDTEQLYNCFIKLPKYKKGCYVRIQVNMVESPDRGDITGILTVTDITEQTISDLILHQLYVINYDFVMDLNLEKDRYRVLAHNQVFNLPMEGSLSMWVDTLLNSFVVPKDRETCQKCLGPEEIIRRLNEDGHYTFSCSIVGKNGDIRTKNMTVSAVDLRLGRVCLLGTDITESVREQQGLLNMMAYTFELMGFIDLQGRRLTMYTRQSVLENLPPYVVEGYDAALECLKAFGSGNGTGEGMKEQFSLDMMTKQLSDKPAGYDFVFPMTEEGENRYKQVNVLWGDENRRTVCLVRADVTDMLSSERETKKTLEKALADAKEANQAKSDFLSTMSHDIRTPMNAIMGMTTLAEANLDDRGRVTDCLKKISISSRHLLSLINDILDMSKIEHSKIILNNAKISLSDLMAQLSAIIMPQAEGAGIRLNIKEKGIQHPFFYGDSPRLNQILINILSNAVKFTPKGGTVDFEAEEIPPVKSQSMARYRFTVRDTGMGMPEEFLNQLFDPFVRSRNSSHIEGTGLGLSIVKGLVDLMEGEISVESRLGEGTVFTVDLEYEAVKDNEEKAAENGETEAPATLKGKGDLFKGRSFLVAEDNAINAEILCELLKIYGANAVVRSDGAQTVKEFRKSPAGTYDAVLMDIQMPVMNGYDAAREIRKTDGKNGAEIPIVAMTANAFAEDIQEALNAGMNAHVSKPIDLDVLEEVLNRVLTSGKDE